MPREKLVRDRIPEMIRAKGEAVVSRTAADTSEFSGLILDKLYEEVDELAAAETAAAGINEMADVLEVLEEFARMAGVTMDVVRERQAEKRRERGGFEGMTVMEVE